ncbi:ATP-binding protein [Saccharopolyspora shandongensis]|uniref:ATP-binding protein n=1 Tax=Saccharopolyspora shandongensis TaxID=418495 RepID=UPI0033F1B2FF
MIILFSPVKSSLMRLGPWVSVGVVAAYAIGTCSLAGFIDNPLWRALWYAAAGLVTAMMISGASKSRRVSRRYRVEAQRLELRCEVRSAALQEVVQRQLPALVRGAVPPPLPDAVLADEVAVEAVLECAALVRQFRDGQAARVSATQAVLVALGRSVQASALRIQEEAALMLQRHPADPDVLRTSMRVDHAAAQQARQAQSVAVLCGQPPGQQWPEPLPLDEVVRAAAGRITAYQRVEAPGESAVAVSAAVVEPLIHLVAELLANATQSSPPTANVLVSVRPVQRGAVIEIDDGGLGMEGTRLERARQIASGRERVSVADLGELPQTGLPVVGAFARRHGIRVDLTGSAYGGIKAIVLIPSAYIETVAATVPAGHVLALPSARGPAVPERAPEQRTTAHGATREPDGLPRRRSRRGEAVPPPAVRWPTEPPPPVREESPEEAGEWMSAFFAGDHANAPDHHGQPPVDHYVEES